MALRDDVYIYGKHPVMEALTRKTKEGKFLVQELYITKQKADEPAMVSFLQKSGVTYQKLTEEEISSKVGRHAVHQGMAALVDISSLYVSLEDFLAAEKSSSPCLILLDELEDPHNVGAIIRSAVAFGAHGVLLPSHGQALVNGTVAKTSAGTIFSIPLIKIGNVNTTLKELKEKGYWTYALTGNGDTSLHDAKFDTPTVFVIGSEGKGVREKTEATSDFRLSIPIEKDCESLNASNAVAVTLYEWKKQQKGS